MELCLKSFSSIWKVLIRGDAKTVSHCQTPAKRGKRHLGRQSTKPTKINVLIQGLMIIWIDYLDHIQADQSQCWQTKSVWASYHLCIHHT